MSSTRVSADDLSVVIAWLEMYEAAPDDPSGESVERVAAWLKRELINRNIMSAAGKLAREHNMSATDVAKILKRKLAAKGE